ncbi:MAG: MATE family efflux transporter [Ignavibacteriales bacterium]|nr:MATE family efflux transporter [Ignavibacteriales bacterium]
MSRLMEQVSYFFFFHRRTVKAKKNIVALFVLRGLSVLTSLMLVPLTLHSMNSTNYGIWLTLTSVIGWLTFADVGLGNGLRNKYAEARARGEMALAQTYVSTAYALLAIVVGVLCLICVPLCWVLPWTDILNAASVDSADLRLLALVVFVLFCVRFLAQLISSVAAADQMPAINGVIELSANVFSLMLVWTIVRAGLASLFSLGAALSIAITLVPVAASVYLFKTRYRASAPRISAVRMEFARELMNIGAKFFLIQMSGLIMYTTSNIIIAQLFGPAEVTPYNLAARYFGVITTGFGILAAPLWSAFSEAYVQNDLAWVQRITKTMLRIWLGLVVVVAVMVIFSNEVYRFWVGGSVGVPLAVSLFMGIFVLLLAWGTLFVNFINGTGKIQLQLYVAVACAIINIPLTLAIVKVFHLGIEGVVLAQCIVQLVASIWVPLQYKKLVTNTAVGIWAR